MSLPRRFAPASTAVPAEGDDARLAQCPEPETLARYAEASLEPSAVEAVRQHLDGCPACRELLVALVRSSQPSPGPTPDTPWDIPVPGSRLGRYQVTGTRGAGGMGVVLAAYDPQLDRQVALKLLRPDLDLAAPEQGRLRLVREAQLMAQVRHPNVVTVHDVVVEGERVFIAMELVEGQTLRDWLEQAPRPPAEVLRVFRAAGQGLAAAHRAGVVHRDFKADNVLVDFSGQVLVSDFGLAWSTALEPPPRLATASPGPLGLSRRSAAIGTPAYMAPEQLLGEPVEARADQFSFCVALYEALEGARPFQGETSAALLQAIEEGRLRPARRPMPRPVAQALRRGLSRQPQDRFPNMQALLEALEPSGRGHRRAAGGAALALGLLGLWLAVGVAQRSVSCAPMRARVLAAWSPARRAAVQSRLPTTASTAALLTRVDGLAQRLLPAWDAVCAAPHDDAARARACLESRVQGLEVTAEVLAMSSSDARASSALVSRLDGPEGCQAGELLTLVPPPSGAGAQALLHAARVSALTADALRYGGQLEPASVAAPRAVAEAGRTGWRPVEADARLAAAQVLRARGRFAEAEAMLGEALLAAEAGRHFEAIARIAVQHVLVVGTQSVRPDDAEPWVKRAEAALEQLPRPRLRAEVDVAITMLRVAQGRLNEGLEVSARALAWSAQNGLGSAADLHQLRAQLFLQHGLHARGLAEARLSAAQREEVLGPQHPLTSHARLTLAELTARSGLADDALAALEPAIAWAQQSESPVNLATALVARSVALELRGRQEEAVGEAVRARELLLPKLGARHRYLALAERAVGERLHGAGRDDEAIAALGRAVAVGTQAVGAAHRETLESRALLALVLARRADPSADTQARAVLAAVEADPLVGEAPLVAAHLALASLPTATQAQRALALETAQRVRGGHHPDVARALLLQARAADAGAQGAARAELQALQVVEAALGVPAAP